MNKSKMECEVKKRVWNTSCVVHRVVVIPREWVVDKALDVGLHEEVGYGVGQPNVWGIVVSDVVYLGYKLPLLGRVREEW